MGRFPKVMAGVAGAVVLAGGVLAGCGGSDAVPAASSLVGSWKGEAVGYSTGNKEEAFPLTIAITEADDANGTFAGERRAAAADASRVGMNTPNAVIDGVVSPWGEISMVNDGGEYTLELEGDTLVGRYLEVGEDSGAKAVTLTRQG